MKSCIFDLESIAVIGSTPTLILSFLCFSLYLGEQNWLSFLCMDLCAEV